MWSRSFFMKTCNNHIHHFLYKIWLLNKDHPYAHLLNKTFHMKNTFLTKIVSITKNGQIWNHTTVKIYIHARCNNKLSHMYFPLEGDLHTHSFSCLLDCLNFPGSNFYIYSKENIIFIDNTIYFK